MTKIQKIILDHYRKICDEETALRIISNHKNNFKIWVIPHTLKHTNLSHLKINDFVNIEIDILSKYVKKFLNAKKKI